MKKDYSDALKKIGCINSPIDIKILIVHFIDANLTNDDSDFFYIYLNHLKKRKYPIVGIINILIKIIESCNDRILSNAKKEINIMENQNIIETKKKLSFKKL